MILWNMGDDGRSQWPRGLRSSAARLLRSWIRIPSGAWMFVCCECCVLSGRGLCDGLITRPEESYWMWRVVVCVIKKPRKKRMRKPATGLWKIQPQWVVTPGKQTNKRGRRWRAEAVVWMWWEGKHVSFDGVKLLKSQDCSKGRRREDYSKSGLNTSRR
jgi:hypothetical protein